MLAYVFWHWSKNVSAGEYEARQRAFHEALRAEPPAGFRRSFTHAISGAPWANDGGSAYEDWYLVDDSAALDALNSAAVTASRAAPHDRAASDAAGGTAGLYRLRLGVQVSAPRIATWFAKPPGMSYAELFARLEPLCQLEPVGLWMRQMTLGPATECCLLGGSALTLPSDFRGRELVLRPVWPDPDPSMAAVSSRQQQV